MRNWFFRIEFMDGSAVYRDNVSRQHAKRAHDSYAKEMAYLKVQRVEYGEMKTG